MYRYIQAMSFDKKTAIKKLSGYDDTFTNHLVKIVVYSDLYSEYVDGWLSDIGRAIYNMSRTAAHSKLKCKDYYNKCFRGFGDCTIDDAAAILADEINRLSRKPVNPFEYVDYTEEQAELLSDVLAMFKQELSKLLASTEKVVPISDGIEFTKNIVHVCTDV